MWHSGASIAMRLEPLSLGVTLWSRRRQRASEETVVPPKKTVRKPAKKAARKTTARKKAKRTLTSAHKKALAEGRTISATVERYLAAINTPKKRGRQVTAATLTARLADARARAKNATGVEKVMAAQQVRDVQAKLAQANAGDGVDMKTLEADFVRVATKFGENRGISYGSWRDAGVSAVVLKRAGVARTRG
jgi:hypothetical protein